MNSLFTEDMQATCTCPHNDDWSCIEGNVYGPCGADNCYGVCSYDGWCDCSLHDVVEHDGISNWNYDFRHQKWEFSLSEA